MGHLTILMGVVEKVDFEKNRLKVSVLVFGKPTPIELSLTQLKKDKVYG